MYDVARLHVIVRQVDFDQFFSSANQLENWYKVFDLVFSQVENFDRFVGPQIKTNLFESVGETLDIDESKLFKIGTLRNCQLAQIYEVVFFEENIIKVHLDQVQRVCVEPFLIGNPLRVGVHSSTDVNEIQAKRIFDTFHVINEFEHKVKRFELFVLKSEVFEIKLLQISSIGRNHVFSLERGNNVLFNFQIGQTLVINLLA